MKTIAQQLNIKKFPFIIKDDNGNKIYYEESTYWEKQEFDSNNNKIYYENYKGYWWKSEYDTNNNWIYYVTSNGNWNKREYDTNNNEIYYEDSTGYWEKSEYDTNNNKIYFENSKRTIQDHRPKESCEGKIVEIDGKKYKLTEVKCTCKQVH